MAIIYSSEDSLQKARTYYSKALQMAKDLYSPTHPEIANISSNLSSILLKQGRVDSAQLYIAKAVDITGKRRPAHPRMADHLSDYASVLRHQKRYTKANSLYDKALKIYQSNYKGNHPHITSALHDKAINLHLMGKNDKAQKLLRKILNIRINRREVSDEAIQEPLQLLLKILENNQQTAKADSLREAFS